MVRSFATAITLCVLPIVAAAAQPLRIGFEIVRTEDDATLAADTVLWRYRGPIEHPLAANLDELTGELPDRVRVVILELDSTGGDLKHAASVIDVLKRLRRNRTLHTSVPNGSRCLSACIPVFLQGERRKAGNASVWLFHGACSYWTNIPSPSATAMYVQMLADAGVSREFLCHLESKGVFDRPGQFWLSGHELHEARAGILTELLPAWQPQSPVHPPFDPNLRPR